MFANAMRILCFIKNILQLLTGVCCCSGFWSVFFFAPSAILAFANAMRISCFMKNILLWLTGVCRCLGFLGCLLLCTVCRSGFWCRSLQAHSCYGSLDKDVCQCNEDFMFHEEHFAVVVWPGFVAVWGFGVPSSLHCLPF